MFKNLLLTLLFIFPFYALSAEESQNEDIQVVEPKMRNSLPSSKYDNPTSRPVRIPHPNARKGLTRITSDKEYIYETIKSPIQHRMAVKFGTYDPVALENEDGIKFTQIYQQSDSPMLLVDYEWPWFAFMGKVSLQVSSGLFFTQGNGVFENNIDREAREQFTFVAIPLSGNIIWKLQFWETQWFVPFGGGGVGVMGFSEIRDDGESPKFGGALAFPVFAGLGISLNGVAPDAARKMDREYGINNSLLAFEYRYFIGNPSKFDFSGDVVNAGLMVEY